MKTNIYILIFLSFFVFISCSTPKTEYIPEQISDGDQRLIRGNNLLLKGNNDDAAFNFIKAYKFYSSVDDISGCGASLTGLSISFFRQNRSKESFMFLNKAETYYKSLDDLNKLCSFYITKATLLTELEKYNEAEEFLNKAKNLKGTDQRLNASFAILEIKKKNLDKAKEYLDKIISDEKSNSSFIFYAKGLYELEKKEFENAENNFLKALETDKKNGETSNIASDLEALYRLYKAQKNIKKAENNLLRALKIYAIMENSVKTNKLIEELKSMKKGSGQDLSVENFFLEKWID